MYYNKIIFFKKTNFSAKGHKTLQNLKKFAPSEFLMLS